MCRVFQHRQALAACERKLDDIATADDLAVDESLRKYRKAGDLGQCPLERQRCREIDIIEIDPGRLEGGRGLRRQDQG